MSEVYIAVVRIRDGAYFWAHKPSPRLADIRGCEDFALADLFDESDIPRVGQALATWFGATVKCYVLAPHQQHLIPENIRSLLWP